MKQDKSEKLGALDIDVDQWRREIQAFVDATINELQATNDELSCDFAGGKSQGSSSRGPLPSKQAGEEGVEQKTQRQVQDSKTFKTTQSAPASRSCNAAPFAETQTDDRLASLKQRLAERISPPIQSHQ